MTQLRRAFFTWNNWQEDFGSKEEVRGYFEALPHIAGAVVGFEVGDSGTPHLQGVVRFSQAKTFATVVKYVKQNHVEKVKNLDASVAYCKKDGDFFELGEIVDARSRTDISKFKDAVLEGASDFELFEDHTQAYLRYGSMVDRVRHSQLEQTVGRSYRDVKTVYLGGKTGLGKTSLVYDLFGFEDVYRVSSYNHPFDGYRGQSVLVLDEFRGQLQFSFLLQLLDRYPLSLPARYADRMAAFNSVIILSNRRLDEQYMTVQFEEPASWAALERRIGQTYFVEGDFAMDQAKNKISSFLA